MDRRKFLRDTSVVGSSCLLPLVPGAKLLAAAMPADLVDFSALELSTAIARKQVSCVEAMQAYLQHIHRVNPVYNAIVGLVEDDQLIDQARLADRELAEGRVRGWMHGLPHAVKDLTPVTGLLYTSGSPLFADRIAESDASFVSRLRNSGAIFIGKTNSPEFGLGSQTYNPVFGPTASAWNPNLTAGGSSGGAASGLGTHMLPVADGSDMMGSLRNPGAFNNVIGFRPSADLMRDTKPQTMPLSTSGPMGRNTADTIQLLQTMAPSPIGGEFKPLNLDGLRIGWLGNLEGYLAVESGILPLCERELRTLQNTGASVEPVMPRFSLTDLWESWTTLRHSGRTGLRQYYDDPETRSQLKPELIYEIEQLLALTEEDVNRANLIRAEWMKELDRLFAQYDFLAIPSAQVFPYSKDIPWPRFIGDRRMDTYHRWMEIVIPGSMGGVPVINVPVGFDSGDRPMGMQIMGKYGDDKRVLEFGLAYEGLVDHLRRRPELVTASA
ncbi:MAG: amidase [Gammaproteobacteria bacterium]|nr:amidase [Pseudomonadales bacterium]